MQNSLFHEAKQEMRNVFSICEDRSYMCDMHAHGHGPKMHVEQNPAEQECLSLGMMSGSR